MSKMSDLKPKSALDYYKEAETLKHARDLATEAVAQWSATLYNLETALVQCELARLHCLREAVLHDLERASTAEQYYQTSFHPYAGNRKRARPARKQKKKATTGSEHTTTARERKDSAQNSLKHNSKDCGVAGVDEAAASGTSSKRAAIDPRLDSCGALAHCWVKKEGSGQHMSAVITQPRSAHWLGNMKPREPVPGSSAHTQTSNGFPQNAAVKLEQGLEEESCRQEAHAAAPSACIVRVKLEKL